MSLLAIKSTIITLICMLVSSSVLAGKLPKPLTDNDFQARNLKQEELGKFLFFDKILSGNRNISCATCHHPLAATGDGLSLGIGEGGDGLGVTRNLGSGVSAVHERVPRNAPHIFNLGAKQFNRMFHDGRVEIDASQPSGFLSPANDDLPTGIFTNSLQVQAMFPVTSTTEMAGNLGENEVADAASNGDLPKVWSLLAQRLQNIPEYVTLFKAAFPGEIQQASNITYAHAAVAIAAFEAAAWRTDNSRFDQYLRGKHTALSAQELSGMRLFYGNAKCSTCHQGVLQSDHEFHAVAMPQIGPGKGDNQSGFSDNADDFGRERVTTKVQDRFKFRTPSLRMVCMTGPWGHDGAYNSLRDIIKHQINPTQALEKYDTAQAVLPSRDDLDYKDFAVQTNAARRNAIAAANELRAVKLSEKQIDALEAFLQALTDINFVDLRRSVPSRVPSGLPLAE